MNSLRRDDLDALFPGLLTSITARQRPRHEMAGD
jgi:hypothetical protein